ncbi:RDD family protein [Zunongwangia atlantica]|uniref:RDD family protein n=1 Tax=Zunongwangia atlantica 22II14-10F7 TaxID=1185767 RepID=A0A1Y1T3F0_9FLAO|nr:RDD family protein [Zunongwangia atlantica]ORL45556.1 RDD family protein [Zunongwangia atlantica 22II14-10F7]
MDNFQIETAQNIEIQQNSASIGDRILAYLVDFLIIIVYAIITALLIAGFEADRFGEMVYYMVIGLPIFLYYLLFETFWDGKTPGKSAMKIRVVKLDGSRPAFVNYLIRWLLRVIDISLGSGSIAVVTILLNGKGQRLGDMAAKTTVISEKRKVSLANTLAVEIPEDYVPKYPQVTILKDRDVQEVKEIYRKARLKGNVEVITALAEKLSSLLGVKFDEKPSVFIKRVIEDYNYFTQK